MSPRYPRQRQPLQVGIFLPQVNPLLVPSLLEAQEEPARGQYLPVFNSEDEAFLLNIGVWL